MSKLEKLSLSETLSFLTDKDAQKDLLKRIKEEITNEQFTEATLECIGCLVIDGMKLQDLVEMHIQSGRLIKKDGKILFSGGGEKNG